MEVFYVLWLTVLVVYVISYVITYNHIWRIDKYFIWHKPTVMPRKKAAARASAQNIQKVNQKNIERKKNNTRSESIQCY